MRLYAELALVAGVPFGVIMGFTTGPVESTGSFLLSAVAYGAPFGILVSAIIGTLHRRAMRRRGLED